MGQWTFDEITNSAVVEMVTGKLDALTGNYRVVTGVSGKAIKFDGYTTVVTRKAADAPKPAGAFSVSAWIALAAYPWNWCPIVSHQEENGGYSFEIGPDGEMANLRDVRIELAGAQGRWPVASIGSVEVGPGDVFVIETPGGGGFGPARR